MIDTSLIHQLPPIQRARGDRFYAGDKHWVDLWKQGGAWLFGHRPEGAAREWKNQLDKGLSSHLPTRWTARLQRHLNELFGLEAKLRLYPNVAVAVEALEHWKAERFSFQDYDRALWKPLRDEKPLSVRERSLPGVWSEIILPVLPAGPVQAVAVLLAGATTGLPEAPLVAVTEVAALVRAVVTLRRKLLDPVFAKTSALVSGLFDRVVLPTGVFRRHGLWLEATCEPEDYEFLFTTLLEAGFVLSPDQSLESLLPLALSEGEAKAWKLACERFLAGAS